MSHNNKIYLGIIIFFIIFAVVIFFLFGYNSMIKDKDKTTIVIGNDTVWRYNKQKWEYITDNYILDDYVDEIFNVYREESFKKIYLSYKNGEWIGYDKNKNEVKLEEDFFAYQSNIDIEVKSVEIKNINNMKYVNRVLDDNNLSRKSKFTSSYMFSFDIDKDGKEEDFYAFTNAFPMGFKTDKIFTFAYIVKHDKIYYIYKDVEDYHGFNGCKPYFTFIMDADDDSILEFVFNCGLYSTSKPIRRLYQFNDNEIKMLVSNEI